MKKDLEGRLSSLQRVEHLFGKPRAFVTGYPGGEGSHGRAKSKHAGDGGFFRIPTCDYVFQWLESFGCCWILGGSDLFEYGHAFGTGVNEYTQCVNHVDRRLAYRKVQFLKVGGVSASILDTRAGIDNAPLHLLVLKTRCLPLPVDRGHLQTTPAKASLHPLRFPPIRCSRRLIDLSHGYLGRSL